VADHRVGAVAEGGHLPATESPAGIYLKVPVAFGSWRSDRRRICVFFALDVNGQRRGKARVVHETAEDRTPICRVAAATSSGQ
jgi:hypothetical protein